MPKTKKVNYGQMTNKQLSDELKRRGKKQSGRKKELIETWYNGSHAVTLFFLT